MKSKKWERRFGSIEKIKPYYHHLDLRRIDDLDDEGFAYLLNGIKGVNMLDLNETEITNESIKLLTGLEYVKELRVKGCRLDDGCIPHLGKITSLELLHVKNTSVTIDGLLHLNSLINLNKVLFSADDVKATKEKMLQLKAMHPNCEFIIDGTSYHFDAVERFMHAVRSKPYTYRLKIKNELLPAVWSKWVIQPSDHYVEAETQGPYPINEIEWVEINPVEKREQGRLLPQKEVDHSADIIKLLEELSFTFMVTERIISAYIIKNS